MGADKKFEEESKLYTDGQERVAHNIASKNLFTKCFLTKVALDECNGELETTYSKEFSKGEAGVVQESADASADKKFEEESKLYTDGQERVAHNIASKNLFTKCFLTKVALDECNGE